MRDRPWEEGRKSPESHSAPKAVACNKDESHSLSLSLISAPTDSSLSQGKGERAEMNSRPHPWFARHSPQLSQGPLFGVFAIAILGKNPPNGVCSGGGSVGRLIFLFCGGWRAAFGFGLAHQRKASGGSALAATAKGGSGFASGL